MLRYTLLQQWIKQLFLVSCKSKWPNYHPRNDIVFFLSILSPNIISTTIAYQPRIFFFLKEHTNIMSTYEVSKNSLTAVKWTSLGSFRNWAHKHTLDIMLDLDVVRYKSDPIIALYWVSSTLFDSSCSPRDVAGCIGVFISFASSMLNFLRSSFTYLVRWM